MQKIKAMGRTAPLFVHFLKSDSILLNLRTYRSWEIWSNEKLKSVFRDPLSIRTHYTACACGKSKQKQNIFILHQPHRPRAVECRFRYFFEK